MKVNDPGVIVTNSGLASVEEVDGKVRITLKNKTTLDIEPVVNSEGIFEGFSYDYLTAQQNRKINSLKEKMAKLQNEMNGIYDGDDTPSEEEDTDLEEENLEVNEDDAE